jgi:hypothetical protein
MSEFENAKPYRDRMQSFVSDPDLKALDEKYEPYLDIHQIDNVLDACDTGKLIWDTEYDYPTDLKRDIILLFNRHFVD